VIQAQCGGNGCDRIAIAAIGGHTVKIKPAIYVAAALLITLFVAAVASAETFQTGVIYLCGGERLEIESCNMQNQTDTGSCLVAHPDRPLHNGFMAYTNETRATLKKLIPTCTQPSAADIAKAQAFQKKQQDTQDAARAKALAQMDAPMPAPGAAPASAASSGDQKLIRCIESGRSESQCASNGLLDPVMSMVGALLPGATPAPHSGLDVVGTFRDAGISISFADDSLQLSGCADLITDTIEYSIVMKAGQPVLNVKNLPQPFTLGFRPDGKIAGPGAIDVKGSIVIGHNDYWVTPGATASNPNPVGHRESVPILQAKTARCSVGVLTSAGPFTPDTGNFLGAFGQIMGGTPPSAPAAKKITPGFRVAGDFSGAPGFYIEFTMEWAVLNCGDSGDTVDYTVETTASQTQVKIQDGSTPIILSVKPDGTLAGSGTVPVNGRRIIGKNANGDLTFAPRPATCNLGVLTPGAPSQANGGAASAVLSASSAPAPSPAGAAAPVAVPPNASAPGNAVLSVASGFPAKAGAANPLAGKTLVLLKDSFEVLLTKGGFTIPAGVMPFTAMMTACRNQTPSCQAAIAAINSKTVTGAKIDATGKATFSGVKPGTYYVMGSGAAPATAGAAAQQFMWNVKVDLKAGANSITIDQRNGAPVK
jgi:hypothetical protein